MKLKLIAENINELNILYHGTSIDSLPSIQKNGLDPQKSSCAEDEEENDYYDNYGAPYHFIYLTPELEIAEDFASENNMALLKITLPPELQSQLITNRGEFVRAPFVIEPKYITRIK